MDHWVKYKKNLEGLAVKHYNDLVRHSGNADLFQAIEMSLLALANDYPFHVHAEGLRGTGKTTIMRAAGKLLPPITRVKGCMYNCDPQKPHCPQHRYLSPIEISTIGCELVSRPFLEISHSAKIGTVTGSIDLEKLTDKNQPAAALLPGTVPQAHRGIIFIDEINRLADTSPELADILLDVMGTKPGRIQVEETGLPMIEMPVQVTVWAASNPDEDPGSLMQIRKQLSDRFDMIVNMGRPTELNSIMSVLSLQHQSDLSPKDGAPIHSFTGDISSVRVDDKIRTLLATIYLDFGLESLRALEAMETAAVLSACFAGRQAINIHDVIKVVPLTLAHRVDNVTMTNILKYLNSIESQTAVAINENPAARNPATNKFVVNQQPSNSLRNSWWSNLWNMLKSKLQDKNNSSLSPQNQKNTMTGGNKPALNNSSQGNIAGRQIADPTNTDIIAPPKLAKPLIDLPLDNYVNGEDKTPHA